MTDPIQTTDDILWWEDIFAAIPPATPEEVVAPYDTLLEKKYQFEPIPEAAPVAQPVRPVVVTPVQQAPVAQVQVQRPAPVQTPVQQATPVAQVQAPVQQLAPVQATVEVPLDKKLQTDVQKKFGELYFTTKKIYELKDKLGTTEETFDILWANNDKIFISYRFLIDETNDPILFITKIEQDKETEEETKNELRFTFNEESSSLEVMINDTLLFDEIKDFTEDQKKKLQVVDKINKFTFLASEEVRKLEKEIKEKEEAERERKRLQEIFRNF
ncbi:MAG: hypothetical protein ACD_80C00109G0002 [uncultured bacterium (gcode 4)]|uniref:Uncharacterized protein n=1 Tax=uncultured bacterium (gcode 4) TaxID=1234023 RepID=K1XJ10_9BACT|nr:MAG: hypothetical protein ACD_80C00109G0002 [uncultured bacterium (gcode 4)]